MLLLDPRTGSGDLAPTLRALGMPVDVTHLEFGDASFMGAGPGGRPTSIGVEIKKLADILQCIETGRWSGHQLPGLVTSYDIAYLAIEGIYRAHPETGVLETQHYGKWTPVNFSRRNWMYRDFAKFLITQTHRGGVYLWQTSSRDETARFVSGLYSWWQEGSDHHASHESLDRTTQINLRATVARERGGVASLSGDRLHVPLVRKLAAELPGVGVERSRGVAERFPTVRALVDAGVEDWEAIPGIGKKIAARIVAEINADKKA